MDEPALRVFLQKEAKKLTPIFKEVTDPLERIKVVLSQPVLEGLKTEEFKARIKVNWPRKNAELGTRNREDGNNAFQKGNHEMAVLLYTEAMKYSPTDESMEGEGMAIAAANRFVSFTMQLQLCRIPKPPNHSAGQLPTSN